MDFSLLAEGQGRWLLAGLLVAALIVWALWRMQRPTALKVPGRSLDAVDTLTGWPPEATRLLTHRHRRAYELLRRSVPEYLVFAQVPVARFVGVPARLSYAEWMRRVGSVCVDLLVCDRASNVVAVVEVRETGRSMSERARKRHQRIERVLRAVGVTLQVWDEAWLPDPIAVRRTLVPELDDAVETASPTLPMDLGVRSGGEPPRSTWFDELNASGPARLDEPVVPPVDAGYGVRADPVFQRR
ncbi:MAG: DUF2726 domain-containing protein [Burkholderiales bacterium]